MGSSFGGSIKLSGESEYRKALKECDSSLRVLGSELKEVTKKKKKNDLKKTTVLLRTSRSRMRF